MHRKLAAVFLLMLVLLLSVGSLAFAQGDAADADPLLPYGGNTDDLAHPLGKQQRALRQTALQQRLLGVEAPGGVMQLGPGQYVELEREDADLILTILGEFGNRVHPNFGGATGPRFWFTTTPNLEKLLRRFPLEAGVSPGFRGMDDAASAAIADAARKAVARLALKGEGRVADRRRGS